MVVVVLLVPFGTIGYMLVGELDLLDALYQTMITLSTVGYGDLVDQESVPGKIFTILFLTVGVGVFVVTLSTLAAFLVEGRLREAIGSYRMERDIQALRGHIILCGYGSFGQTTAAELIEHEADFALIEIDHAKVAAAEERGILALEADATQETVLKRAGIEHAKGIIATLGTDAANVYVALTTKEIRPELEVVTIARDPDAESKLRAAGADHVLSPYTMGGVNLARRMLQPHLSDFLEGVRGLRVRLEEIAIRTGSPLAHTVLRDTQLRERFGVSVVALVKSKEKDILYNPPPDTELEPGDVLVCVGTKEGLHGVEGVCATQST